MFTMLRRSISARPSVVAAKAGLREVSPLMAVTDTGGSRMRVSATSPVVEAVASHIEMAVDAAIAKVVFNRNAVMRVVLVCKFRENKRQKYEKLPVAATMARAEELHLRNSSWGYERSRISFWRKINRN